MTTVEGVTNRIQVLKDLPDLKEEVRKKAVETLNSAIPFLQNRQDLARKADEYDASIQNAPSLLEAMKNEAKAEVRTDPYKVPSDQTADQIQQATAQAQADLDQAKEKLKSLEDQPKQRETRKKEIPTAIATAKAKLDEIELALKTALPAGEAPEISSANLALLQARRSFRRQEISTLEKELRLYEATSEMMTVSKDRAQAKVTEGTKKLEALQKALAIQRKKESEEAARKAEQDQLKFQIALRNANPLFAKLARENIDLAKDRVDLASRIEKISQERSRLEREFSSLEIEYKDLRDRVLANEALSVPMTDSIGVLLRRQKDELLRKSGFKARIRARQREMSEAQIREIDLKSQRDAQADLELQIKVILDGLTNDSQLLSWERYQIEDAIRKILQSRKEYLDELTTSYTTLAEQLAAANLAEGNLMRQVIDFREFINQRILWIRSSGMLDIKDVQNELSTWNHLLAPTRWLNVGRGLQTSFSTQPGIWLLSILILLGVLGPQRWARRRIQELGSEAQDRHNTKLKPTFQALGLTLLSAMAAPVILWVFGSRLLEIGIEGDFIHAKGQGLVVAGMVLFTFDFYRGVCRPNGLAQCHFNWPKSNIELLRKHNNWLRPIAIPLLFLVTYTESFGLEESQARIAFFIGMLLLVLFFNQLLDPDTGLKPTQSSPGNPGIRHRLRQLRYLMSVLLPLGLAAASVLGYHYTAVQLAWRSLNSIWVILIVMLSGAILVRWFYLERRRLALAQLKQRREQARANGEKEAGAEDTPEVNLSEVKTQTQSLTRALVTIGIVLGLYAIWVDVLPALNVLNKVELWKVEVTVDASTSARDTTLGLPPGLPTTAGNEASLEAKGSTTQLQSITLANLGLCILILFFTLAASRNLPGLLEITLLRHLKIPAGSGYAVTTLGQYVITLLGIVFACGAIGLSWEKVQWLAAAISLGIGFGLQEIVANFVSGLILLFERPIRIGDVVTVGDVTGKVTQLRIRATTITDWDRKEFIVPNREFVTGRLLNWTLSDTTNRVVITVGISYSSDVDQALQILKQTADDQPLLMKDPAPLVTFEGFGDNALNLVLRCYLPNLDNRLAVVTDLHKQILAAYRAAGIEIAFPQRDLHIRSLPQVILASSNPPSSTSDSGLPPGSST